MDNSDLERAVEAILFAAGEPVGAVRMAGAVGCEVEDIHAAAQRIMDRLSFARSGIRVLRLEDAYQMCSSGELAEVVSRALETRKPPKLSPSQLETLTIIAYYQPTTKAYVEQLRGVDSAYSVGALLTKKLIEEDGRLNVPGRPILYKTTPAFLRTFGLESLEDLPPIEKAAVGVREDQQLQLQDLPEPEGGS
ncbi:MAG: SMC-Scp complex subunit ScpB [Oscillospiraceae bacterium]|nr:SMC-Scp complex subunit ScpB [Oscillospiraceae bacterium]